VEGHPLRELGGRDLSRRCRQRQHKFWEAVVAGMRQFPCALSVRSVRSVRRGMAWGLTPNAPNAPNA
jgi:hypothetical protein